MELYLMQHGSAFSKDVDPDQPLSPVGREQVIKSAQAVRRMGLAFDMVASSPKTRARQTAEVICELIGYPEEDIVISDALKAMAPPTESIQFLEQYRQQGAMLVTGHLPNLAKLAGELLSPGHAPAIQFANGGLTRIDLWEERDKAPVLRWHLTPFHMQVIASA
jgi:phosphohistidine phosphatase